MKRHYEIDVEKLSESEFAEPHLRAIFDLLIRPNPALRRIRRAGKLVGLGA